MPVPLAAIIVAIVWGVDHYRSKNKMKGAEERGRSEGRKAGEYEAGCKYKERMEELCRRVNQYNGFERKLVGLFAVGICVANADGVIDPSELAELMGFVGGLSRSALPDHLKEQFIMLMNNPFSSFNEAMELAWACGVTAEEIDGIVEVVINADGKVDPLEEDFVKVWNDIKYHFPVTGPVTN